MGSTKTQVEMLLIRVRTTCFLFSLQIPSWISCLLGTSEHHDTTKIGAAIPWPVFLPFYFPSLWGIRGLKSSQLTGDRGPRMGYMDKNKNDSQDQLALAVISGSLSPAQNRKHPLCFYLFAPEKIIVSSLKTASLSLSISLRLSRVCFDL